MKKLFIKLILISLVGFTIYVFFNSLIKIRSKESKTIQITINNTAQPQKNPTINLQKAVENALAGTEGIYGIAIKNLENNESYYFNEHKEFEPGSIYKLWILATAFNQIGNGELKENEVLSQKISVLNDKFHIPPESAELAEEQITSTVKEALEQMIVISNNYSALLLSEKVRLTTVKAFLQENNFNQSHLGEPPITTPYDTALFFEKLYKAELANQENTDKMLDILKRQTRNNKLPRYLPQETVIAHKTGEIGLFSHDAGIVYTFNGDYIIAVLSESDSPSQADERIARISQEVYKYFMKDSNN